MIATSILLAIRMHIGPTRFLENDVFNAKYDSKERLRRECIDLNWDDNAKLEKDLAVDDDDKEEIEDLKAKK